MHNLAGCYMEGEGTEKNPELGFKWYLAAGEDVLYSVKQIQRTRVVDINIRA